MVNVFPALKDGTQSTIYPKMVEKGACAACGTTDNLCIHQGDEDYTNNVPSNLGSRSSSSMSLVTGPLGTRRPLSQDLTVLDTSLPSSPSSRPNRLWVNPSDLRRALISVGVMS